MCSVLLLDRILRVGKARILDWIIVVTVKAKIGCTSIKWTAGAATDGLTH